ncbi:MAG TPA: hypothetical protein VGI38_10165 [Puia sp.]|jgi:hypothetical protein
MTTNYSPSFSSALRLTAVSLLLAVTALAFASTGGGKKKRHELENNFTPINTAASFSLKKSSSLYSGSMVSFQPRTDNKVSLNAMITYQHGNTTLILPYQYKVNIGPISNSFGAKSNLQFLGVRIQMPK